MAPLFYRGSQRDSPQPTGREPYLKDLHILNSLLSTALLVNRNPLLDNALNVGNGQPRKSEVMARVEAQDVAPALNGLGCEQRMWCGGRTRTRGRQDRCIVILEDHGVLVFLVLLPACASVSRT